MERSFRVVSPVYLLAAAISWPFVKVGFRLRARGEPHIELRPLAARSAALPATAASLHGEERALQPLARAAPESRRRLSGPSRRGRSRGDSTGGRARARRRDRCHV